MLESMFFLIPVISLLIQAARRAGKVESRKVRLTQPSLAGAWAEFGNLKRDEFEIKAEQMVIMGRSPHVHRWWSYFALLCIADWGNDALCSIFNRRYWIIETGYRILDTGLNTRNLKLEI